MKTVSFFVENTKLAFKHTSRLSHVMSTLTGFFVALVMYQSLMGYHPAPLTLVNGAANAIVDDYSTIFTYEREVTVNRSTLATINRVVTCGNNGVTFDAPRYNRQFDVKGTTSVVSRFTLPFRVAPGTKCSLNTTIVYQPTFSITNHTIPVKDLEFTVEFAPAGSTANRPPNEF